MRIGTFVSYPSLRWTTPEWRWWLRFVKGVYYLKPYRKKRRFESFYLLKSFKERVKFNERFGTPRKSKAFDKFRLPKRMHKNKFHFSRIL